MLFSVTTLQGEAQGRLRQASRSHDQGRILQPDFKSRTSPPRWVGSHAHDRRSSFRLLISAPSCRQGAAERKSKLTGVPGAISSGAAHIYLGRSVVFRQAVNLILSFSRPAVVGHHVKRVFDLEADALQEN